MIEQPHSEDEGGEGEGGSGQKSTEDDEDLERKKLYLLVARCIAFPFNAKYQIETTPPRVKLNRERFGLVCRTLRAVVEDFSKVSVSCIVLHPTFHPPLPLPLPRPPEGGARV